jgi:tetratricopeptide (TPR) repeat protein
LKADIDELIAAGRQTEAATALRRLITIEPGCHPAYRKLGVTCLRLGDLAAAERLLLEAARRMPDDPGAFDGLAETYGHLGEVAKARQAGRRALVLKDAAAPFHLGPPPAPPPRPGGTRLIAFSLFGAHPRYCETAILNAEAALELLPGWTCRVYADATVPLARVRGGGAHDCGQSAITH